MAATDIVLDPARLTAERQRRAYGMRELARLAGVSHAALIAYERGARNPAPPTIRKLAAALGVEPAQLLQDAPGAGGDGDCDG